MKRMEYLEEEGGVEEKKREMTAWGEGRVEHPVRKPTLPLLLPFMPKVRLKARTCRSAHVDLLVLSNEYSWLTPIVKVMC